MKKYLFFCITILFLVFVFFVLIFNIKKYNQENENLLSALTTEILKPDKFILDVPYINEAPDGNFSGNWKNGCEEASIAMVEKYYLGKKSVSIEEAKSFMQNLFDIQDRLYGSNASTDAARTAKIINNYTSFNAVVKDNPTIEDIRRQIRINRPVISLHYGFDLQNPNIPFSRIGSYYHMLVVVGYNDETQEFIVNDDGDMKNGKNHRYNYDLFMNSLHDYNPSLNKTNGPARVIFTRFSH
ncbi:C39 family peptidase [Patescibacteria group bacterium]|nr:C39 family peptidase [Patescibacteria group bacterium]MBU4458565.1 C39 family peptidase [Patescibacteria group bacterium]MCG2696093.1 C39 family peptidase [Candidatus Portnoybacteria bacterium]